MPNVDPVPYARMRTRPPFIERGSQGHMHGATSVAGYFTALVFWTNNQRLVINGQH